MYFLKKVSLRKTQNSLSGEAVSASETGDATLLGLFDKKLNSLNGVYKKYLLWIIPLLMIGCFIIVLLSLFHRDQQLTHLVMQLEDKRTVLVRDQISDIRAQLDKLAISTQNSPEAQSTLTQLSDELRNVEKNMTGVAKSIELQKMAADIDEHFTSLEKTVASSGNAKSYLDVKVLPFQVVSIDVIAQQPFVSVDYAHHTMPLGVGDSLAGWKVVNADYSTVEVEFENSQGQYVKVNALGNIASGGDKT